jgi:transposase-like protein
MTTDNTTGHDPDARAAAVDMLKAGEADVSDIARLAGVDRRVVHYWAKVEKIDVAARRNAKQAAQWRGHLAKVKGKAKPRRMSKSEMRDETEKAIAAFNRKRRSRS